MIGMPEEAPAPAGIRAAAFLRSYEWLLVGYFVLAALRAAACGRRTAGLVDAAVALIFPALAVTSRVRPRLWVEVLRDWVTMPFLLLAYWNAGFFTAPHPDHGFEMRWVRLDRLILNDCHGRQIVESLGSLVPALLEFAYLMLYAAPPVLLGAVYLLGGRRRSEGFLFTLFAGTLLTYCLLPLFPSASPWIEFPGQDLPSVTSVFRRMNLFLLERLDIHNSVFPSGHVTVAFSCLFGVILALPGRRWLAGAALVFALAVSVNTVYARYHYAIDGVAGLAISILGFSLSRTVVLRQGSPGNEEGRINASPRACTEHLS